MRPLANEHDTDSEAPIHGQRLLRVLRPFLRVPLFYKLVVGNLAVVLAAAAAAAWLPGYLADHARLSSPLAWAGVGAGVLACLLVVNVLLVRFALSPIRDLQRAARRVCPSAYPSPPPPIRIWSG